MSAWTSRTRAAAGRAAAWLIAAAAGAAAGCSTGASDSARRQFLETVAADADTWHSSRRWTSECLREGHIVIEWLSESGGRLGCVRVEKESHLIADPDDLRPYIVPIESEALAVEYSNVLRLFEFRETRVPGVPLRDDDAAIDWDSPAGREAARIDVSARPGEFEIVRTVRMRAGGGELCRIREFIGTDGSYRFERVP